MSVGGDDVAEGRRRLSFAGWVGDPLDLRELVRAVENLAAGALETAIAELEASEPERRAAWDADLPDLNPAVLAHDWGFLERRRREQIQDHFRVTMQVREEALGEAWAGDALEVLDIITPSRLRFVAMGAGETTGEGALHRRIDLCMSPVIGAFVSCAGPVIWIEQVQAVLGPLMRARVPWYKILRSSVAPVVGVVGSAALTWFAFDRWLHLRESVLGSMAVALLVAVNYLRVLDWAAPKFELTDEGGRPRSLLRIALVAAGPFLFIAGVAAFAVYR